MLHTEHPYSRTFDSAANVTQKDFLRVIRPEKLSQLSPEIQAQIAQWSWKEQELVHPENGFAIAAAFFGEEYQGAQAIHEHAVRLMSTIAPSAQVPFISESSGFSSIYFVPSGFSDHEYAILQEEILRTLLNRTLEQQDKTTQDVDAVFITTSIPLDENFAERTAAGVGLKKSIPTIGVCMACNSTGWAFAETHAGRLDSYFAEAIPDWDAGQPATVAILALDDQTKHMDKGADPLSPQLFSCGAAVMLFEYTPHNPEKTTFTPLTSIHHLSTPRGTQYLKVMRPYDNWERKPVIAEHLQTPQEGHLIEMSSKAGVSFMVQAGKLALETLADYLQQPFDETRNCTAADIKAVVVHHPSLPVFEGLKKQLLEAGVSEDALAWHITEGNVPVATLPLSMIGHKDRLQTGDHLLFLTFGAGGEYTCWVGQYN